ncbi:uncharacterized protein LOC112493759 [Cephus cinctus]|uniref:Uncharacterized protein LOC112493759 n=1 Tax=Cephus cinctus TaxID=211228 RepID=A0AAJ7R957_CEPCN|nr:uncharacterized protein LOC112493759 [Cephus cinctus]
MGQDREVEVLEDGTKHRGKSSGRDEEVPRVPGLLEPIAAITPFQSAPFFSIYEGGGSSNWSLGSWPMTRGSKTGPGCEEAESTERILQPGRQRTPQTPVVVVRLQSIQVFSMTAVRPATPPGITR